jgi:hypothetical protein
VIFFSVTNIKLPSRILDNSFKPGLENAYELGSRNTATCTELGHTNQKVVDSAEKQVSYFVCSALNERGERIVNSALLIIMQQILEMV